MSLNLTRLHLHAIYREAADEYLRALTLEDFMESTPQATQRKITVQSLDVVSTHRPEVQVFNELLVQYERRGRRKPGQVVPDNMVVVWSEPINADGSFDVPLQPAKPFWVLEYVSKSNRKKDWIDNLKIYERGLQVPYYLMFEPHIQELILHRHNGTRYVTVLPNEQDRYAIPELELELGLLDGWVRYWFRGELLALTPELTRELDKTRKQLLEERRLRAAAEKRVIEVQQKVLAEQQLREQAEKTALNEKRLRESLEAEVALLRAQLKGASPTSP